MFNPNNIRNKGFSVQKSGYSTDEVSDYLHDVADDYAALVKENQEKDAKIEKLVEKVNELLADKDAITDALVNAQKEARKGQSEARKRRSADRKMHHDRRFGSEKPQKRHCADRNVNP